MGGILRHSKQLGGIPCGFLWGSYPLGRWGDRYSQRNECWASRWERMRGRWRPSPDTESSVLHQPGATARPPPPSLSGGSVIVRDYRVVTKGSSDYSSLTLNLELSGPVMPVEFDQWVQAHLLPALGPGTIVASARPCRPGYFIRTCPVSSGNNREVDFEIRCPNWVDCETNQTQWWEEVPLRSDSVGIS